MTAANPKQSLFRRALRWAVRIAAFTGLLSVIAGVAGWWWLERTILSTLPTDLSAYRTYRPPSAVQVFDPSGKKIDEFYLERRVWVPIAEVPPVVWQAFIAAEDRRFMEHPGVDLLGIARAFVTNLQAGRDVQGASTITQQLVKNLIVGKERSYERKIREAVLAYRLEQELDKTRILELYINYIALGSGNAGVEAAAQDYFGVSARDLDAGQAALLAGLVPAPSRYSPRNDPETAGTRRELVLGQMVEMGFLAPDEANRYAADPVIIPRRSGIEVGIDAAYRTMVRREVRRLLGNELPYAEGLRVEVAYDAAAQQVADEAIREAVRQVEARQGRRGALRHVPRDQIAGWTLRAHGLGTRADGDHTAYVPPAPGACFEAIYADEQGLDGLVAGPFRFRLADTERQALVRSADPEVRPRTLAAAATIGDVYAVCAGADGEPVRLRDRPWPEGSAVVLENATGRVLAVVGGWEVGLEDFVRATQARRQPGSSFKPYVYATALLAGHTQTDTVLDAPISLPGATGPWRPRNYAGTYAGPLSMRRALAKSLNTVSVRLILESGVSRVIDTARAMGVRSPLRADPTLALGSSEVTPLDQAVGYMTIARMGSATDPVYIDRLRDVDGQLLGEAGTDVIVDGEAVARLPGGAGRRALPPGVAYELADMLREVVRGGTGRKAWNPDFDRAGKTGTTNGYVDAWFVGFTPRYTVAVWIGTDGTQSLGEGETGGKAALPAWLTIVEALPHAAGERMPVPDEAMLVPWEGAWIGLPRGAVGAKLLAAEAVTAAPLPAWPDGRERRPAIPLPRVAAKKKVVVEIEEPPTQEVSPSATAPDEAPLPDGTLD